MTLKYLLIKDFPKFDPLTAAGMAVCVRGVLGNKCAGQHNLKTGYFIEKLASGNVLAWLSAVCVFFCSALSTLGQRRRAIM
jgi:hypothetical protein